MNIERPNSSQPVTIRPIGDRPRTDIGTSQPKNSITEEFHPVCKQSIESVKDNDSVKQSWGFILNDHINSLSTRGVDTCGGAYASRSNKKYENSKDGQEKQNEAGHSTTLPEKDVKEFERTNKTTPSFLQALYLETSMNPDIISTHLVGEKQQETKESQANIKNPIGKSASKWTFDNLIDLSCIPLLNVPLSAIIPDDFATANEVVPEMIRKNGIVNDVLEKLTEATREHLTLFKSDKKMSYFVQNPWCLCFTLLRDLLSRKDAEIKKNTWDNIQRYKNDSLKKRPDQTEEELKKRFNVTIEQESIDQDEDKDETASEQLLHRFMEMILLLFSALFPDLNDLRSTPGHIKDKIGICNIECELLDDGYVYLTRGGTTPINKQKGVNRRRPWDYERGTVSNRNRYGKVPVMRYEAKRLDDSGDSTCQIFSELFSSAVLNMRYAEDNDPETTIPLLPSDVTGIPTQPINHGSSLYHDAFVISIRHYHLSIHTARFPESYLKWVTTNPKGKKCPTKYCILHKASTEYDLSQQKPRHDAALDILMLLWAINFGTATPGQKLHVARILVEPKLVAPDSSVSGSKKEGIEIEK